MVLSIFNSMDDYLQPLVYTAYLMIAVEIQHEISGHR